MVSVIHFAQPYWIVAGLLFCLGAIFLWRRLDQQRQERMEHFAAAHLLGHLTRNIAPRRRLLKKGLWILAIFCCFLTLARPQYGFKWVDVKRQGIDILFALDTSRSMLTEDIRPNRLERAKLAIIDFVHQLEGDRVGLLPFAGSAFLLCPLTIDYSAFETALAAIDTAIIPRGGTDLAAAINLAESSLVDSGNHKILILITDGENLEGDALAAATKAGQNGMTIFTVGVGTIEGELIPIAGSGPGNFVRDGSGKFITSRLDETALTAISEAAGGLYVPLGTNGEGLEHIYQQKLSLIPKKELAEKKYKLPRERFTWPLGAAMLLLMLEFIISGRKAERSFRLPSIKTAGRRIRRVMNRRTVSLLLMMTLAGFDQARASKGEEAFADGDFITAAEFYSQALKKRPDDPRLHYNSGTAAYKNNLYEDAITSFQQALKSADLGLQGQTYYNLGNALFKKGEELLPQDPQQTAALWQQSLDAYEGSLKLRSSARDAAENRELVSRRLEELKKQQEQQDKQKEEQQEEQQQDKDDQQQEEDQQGQDKEQGQSENQEHKDQQGKDSDAAGRDSSTAEQEPGDQGGESRESQGDQPAEDDQQMDAAGGEGDKDKQQEDAASQAAQQGQGQDGPVQAGKMTSEEARQLLGRLKDEEGRLNFVPQAENGEAGKEGTWKDW
ncbi:MAG: VWA domain-containing protein [Desulfoarculaceae bacterium]|nr:VWA domain-containing protein [Desulfoarculaceae bacterium]